MINVTKTFLPPLELYTSYVKRAYDNQWLTNRGELVLELENLLKSKLKIPHLLITNNGTIPLQIVLKLFGKNSEIITTPFSYVATTSAIVWENCKPVFVDIDPNTLNIDINKIEKLITKKTSCILATHVFGNPCDVEAIEKIAKKYKLKVIYDAAHCFGVEYKGKSIFNYGDVSTCSFHATKIFHTAEGGAAFCKDREIFNKIYYSHNFGHNGPLDFHGLGINAKISELNAAMGLAMLPFMERIISKRKKIVLNYNSNLNFNKLRKLHFINEKETRWNYSYYPIIFKSEKILLEVQKKLNENNIFPRRYFHPSLNTIKFVNSESRCPNSEKISKTILCLPLYVGLSLRIQKKIISIINSYV